MVHELQRDERKTKKDGMEKDDGRRAYFMHKHRIFIWDGIRINKLKADVHRPVDLYKDLMRFELEHTLPNSMRIDIPSYAQLFYEHFSAPFFVFQIFCGVLWCLDEYVYHSLFTLFMLFVFETGVVFSRRVTMKHYRSMERKESAIDTLVFDGDTYTRKTVSSTDLVPGDVVCIDRTGTVPADMIVLKGCCAVNEAMLTGESLPNYKEDIGELTGMFERQKKHVLFAGTEMVKIEPTRKKRVTVPKDSHGVYAHGGKSTKMDSSINASEDRAMRSSVSSDSGVESGKDEWIKASGSVYNSGEDMSMGKDMNTGNSNTGEISRVHKIDRYSFDDKSVIAMVIETGFGTQQGKLIRKMMTNTPPDNTEAYLFLLFLLVFAVLSSIIVLYQSIKMGKSHYKIMLEIILILTNVVPPELPLELTIAVNAAVHKLLTQGVFCLEPFRIVRAGVLDIACFDKTGTLTESEMVVHRVVAHDEHGVTGILSTCHSLLVEEGEQRRIVGDPLEMSAFTHVNAEVVDESTVRTGGVQYEIKKRFYFSSTLRRMCVVYREGKKRIYKVGMKGAPETVKKFLAQVPDHYDEYRRYATEGYRVLALARKDMHSITESTTREMVESGLTFVGFVLYKSKVKEESKTVVDTLKGAGCMVVMITGDNALTAVAVAKGLDIYNGNVMEGDEITLALDEWERTKGTYGLDYDGDKNKDAGDDGKNRNMNMSESKNTNGVVKSRLAIEKDATINSDTAGAMLNARKGKKTDMADEGSSLSQTVIERMTDLESTDKLDGVQNRSDLTNVSVFARADPKHKERLIRFYKAEGLVTLMCGDGTNDVGALNEADVGVALLVNEQKKTQPESLRDALLNELMDKKVNLGDACVAAPFTIRNGLLSGVLSVVRQGRSTLVTTFQMYKILALNSLITAYSLSFLDSMGIRFNDYQITISGILLAFAFMFLTKCEPLDEISAQRPITGIFNAYFMTSIMLQTAVHIVTTFILVLYIGTPTEYNEKFVPTTLNSSLFILSTSQQVSTFIVNYIGRPFRESFLENTHLRNSLFACLGFCIFVLFEVNVDMNRALEIVDLDDVRLCLLGIMMVDWICCYGLECACAYFLCGRAANRNAKK